MARQLQLKRGTTAEHTTLQGTFAEGELTYDTTLQQMRLHNGTGSGKLVINPFNIADSNTGVAGLSTIANRLDLDRTDLVLAANMGRELANMQALAANPLLKAYAGGVFSNIFARGDATRTSTTSDTLNITLSSPHFNFKVGDVVRITYKTGSTNATTVTHELTVSSVTSKTLLTVRGASTGAIATQSVVIHGNSIFKNNIKAFTAPSEFELNIEFTTPIFRKNYIVVGYCGANSTSRAERPFYINPALKTVNGFTVRLETGTYSISLDQVRFTVYA